jgi:hypothetical protein
MPGGLKLGKGKSVEKIDLEQALSNEARMVVRATFQSM